jgi:hypothetical protein
MGHQSHSGLGLARPKLLTFCPGTLTVLAVSVPLGLAEADAQEIRQEVV